MEAYRPNSLAAGCAFAGDRHQRWIFRARIELSPYQVDFGGIVNEGAQQ